MHADLANRLGKALDGLAPQRIYLGWHTDPYQPCESVHRQTRQVLDLLLERGFSASILTKSDLVLRDLDLLGEMEEASVSVSVAFEDNTVRRRFEANVVDTEARIGALEQLKAAGVRTASLLCPVIPWITNVRALVEMLVPHTERIWVYGLSVMDESHAYWANVQRILTTHFPDLKDRIVAAILDRDDDYWFGLRKDLRQMAHVYDAEFSVHI
jgi:DNA repair photolyase